jgi:TRAP-type C4-dicarboxylate transport system substrate-binding protein
MRHMSRIFAAVDRDTECAVRRFAMRCISAAALLLPTAAVADPITLKLSFFTSDQSVAYQAAVKPFVDAINHDGKSLLHIDVYLSGALGKMQNELPQLVLDGKADIAFIVPGQNPERFRDTAAIEMPGLFSDAYEASLVYTRLIARHALPGYDDFFVVGAYGTAPEIINSRKTLTTLADLKGQKIRVNNLPEAAGLAKLGALPVVLAFNATSPAISGGLIDGATAPPAQLFDVGIGRLTTFHYLLPTSTAPLALVMNRKVFDGLPENAKALIRKYSGEWAADQFSKVYKKLNQRGVDQLEADSRRSVVVPSAADLKTANDDFKSVLDSWTAEGQQNRILAALVQAELHSLRDHEKAQRTETDRDDDN